MTLDVAIALMFYRSGWWSRERLIEALKADMAKHRPAYDNTTQRILLDDK